LGKHVRESCAPRVFQAGIYSGGLDEEGMAGEEEELRGMLEKRSEHFITEEYPFSSEYLGPGASTNHSPCYVLAKLVNNEKLKNTVVRMILSTKDWYPRWYSYAALNKFIELHYLSACVPSSGPLWSYR